MKRKGFKKGEYIQSRSGAILGKVLDVSSYRYRVCLVDRASKVSYIEVFEKGYMHEFYRIYPKTQGLIEMGK